MASWLCASAFGMAWLAAPPVEAAKAGPGATSSVIKGVIRDAQSGEGLRGAVVIASCTCLTDGDVVVNTNQQGLYGLRNLPAGLYHLTVYTADSEEALFQESVQLDRGDTKNVSATVSLDKAGGSVVDVHVKAPPVRNDTTTGTTLDRDVIENLPGAGSGDAIESVVSVDPLGDKQAGGYTTGGVGPSEVDLAIDGGRATNPATGMPAMPIVREFVESIEVQGSGYDAEYGGVSGGRVAVRRPSGTNKLRGVARFTFTPRLGRPRYIIHTDNAVRATEVPDFALLGVIQASGPIVKDRLFWSGGVVASGGRNTLLQTFHAREDKDGSGGYAECPYENGANDCVDGGNYIASRKFAEQSWHTSGVGLQMFGGLDWAINPKHRIDVTARGNPSFVRRSYRRPVNLSSLDPDSMGASPNADPLGGATTTANGLVNGTFGWDRINAVQATANYRGRVLRDSMEIDAGLNFLQTAYEEAWRLDDPSLLDQPSTQLFDGQGAALFRLLDEESGRDQVPGLQEACNAADLPGETCPVRSWVSGGVGQYARDRTRTIGGRAALTHFFNGAGSHQLKYGTEIEHVERTRRLAYSGKNEADFYDNCEAGQVGGGEWCFDPETEAYDVRLGPRVNDHRLMVTNANDPNSLTTLGYGRIRRETGELRAIASPLGHGARVDAYEGNVSTQNYAVFLQDRWAVLSNLFINAGVRWEMQDMHDVLGDRALFIWDNVAPRVGASYDWTDEGKSRLFGSYGWFYQQLPLALLNRAYGGQINVFRQFKAAHCNGQQDTFVGQDRALWAKGQPTEFCPDFPVATTGLTEGITVPHLRGMFDQVGLLGYEQEVIEDLIVGVTWQHRELGRAVEDVSVDGGNNFVIANPGTPVSGDEIEAKAAQCEQLAAQVAALPGDDMSEQGANLAREAKRCEATLDAYEQVGSMFSRPTRNFDAFTFVVRKRFGDNWFLMGSYTYSRHVGNYEGFVDPITGAVNLGSSLQYDTPELVRNSFGALPYNVPHRIKLDGFYTFDMDRAGAITLGGTVRYSSGYPISLRAGSNRHPGAFPIYVLPRGKGGNLEPNHQLNTFVSYAYPLPGAMSLSVGARLFNVTNAKAVLRVDEVYSLQNTRPVAGGDLQDLKHTKIQNAANPSEFFQREILQPQGNFGVEAAFQQPITAQLDLRLMF